MIINNPEEVTVKKMGNYVYEIGIVWFGKYRHRQYIGYTRKQAITKFKKALRNGEL